jgi:hypothetical protein
MSKEEEELDDGDAEQERASPRSEKRRREKSLDGLEPAKLDDDHDHDEMRVKRPLAKRINRSGRSSDSRKRQLLLMRAGAAAATTPNYAGLVWSGGRSVGIPKNGDIIRAELVYKYCVVFGQ